ncbi:conserved hypothetical protein [Nitrosomonas mobilis]|uniref:Transposase n=1 Tax=Nitrosomonas mobilis TaxID=51642 RepID=A0A1G5SGT5_9PROT|nr:conserved hypothetical protein [Nitrosomonas mobilis]
MIAGTVFQGTKLPLTVWFLAIYLVSQAKTGLSGCYHAFNFRKYAARYLAAFSYRFNRRFDLCSLHERLLIAAASTTPQPLHSIRMADVRC